MNKGSTHTLPVVRRDKVSRQTENKMNKGSTHTLVSRDRARLAGSK
jgi:hypothetical protein